MSIDTKEGSCFSIWAGSKFSAGQERIGVMLTNEWSPGCWTSLKVLGLWSRVPTLLVEKQTRREMYQESETDAKRPVLKGVV